MKLTVTFLFVFTIGLCHFSNGQSPFYTFSKTTGTYTQLPGDAQVLTTDLLQNSYSIPIPAGFKLYNHKPDATLTVGRSGWTVTTDASGTLFFAVDPFYVFDTLIKRGGNSGIYTKTENVSGETILKIEWRNVNISGHPVTDSFNFQLWLYKNSQAMEFHYGPSNYTYVNGDTIFITSVFFNDDFSIQYEGHSIYKSGSAELDDTAKGSNAMYQGIPANGTVFRFTASSVGVNEVAANIPAKVYPNPVTDKLMVESPVKSHYVLTDIKGAAILSGMADRHTEISIETLTPGLYFLKISGETMKIIKR